MSGSQTGDSEVCGRVGTFGLPSCRIRAPKTAPRRWPPASRFLLYHSASSTAIHFLDSRTSAIGAVRWQRSQRHAIEIRLRRSRFGPFWILAPLVPGAWVKCTTGARSIGGGLCPKRVADSNETDAHRGRFDPRCDRGGRIPVAGAGHTLPAVLQGPLTPVADWSLEAQRAIVPPPAGVGDKFPGEAAVYMGIVHAAMYDVAVAIHGGYRPYPVAPAAPAETSAAAAIAAAAHGSWSNYCRRRSKI